MVPPAPIPHFLDVQSLIVREPIVASPDMTVTAAIAQMSERRTTWNIANSDQRQQPHHLEARSSCVVVVENDHVVGVLTEAEIISVVAQRQPLDCLLIQQVMIYPVITLYENALTDVADVAHILQQQSHPLPIVDTHDRLIGIVTQSSLLHALHPLEWDTAGQQTEAEVANLATEKGRPSKSCVVEPGNMAVARMLEKAKADRAKLVTQIASHISNSLDLQELLNVCVTEVRAFLSCDRVLVLQFQPDWSSTIIAESVHPDWCSTLGQQIHDSCFQQQATSLYTSDVPIIVHNIYKAGYADCHIHLLEKYQVKANLAVPIRVNNQLWGLLIGHQCADFQAWQPEEVSLLQEISVQLAIAIQQATTYQQLQAELIERQQAEIRLRDSEQRYITLTDVVPVGIFRTDAEGNSIYANPRCCELLGLSPEATLGNGWQQVLHPEDREHVIAAIRHTQQENQSLRLEYRIQRPDGTVIWVLGRAVAERNAVGQVVGYVGSLTDISEDKKILKEREQAEHQLEQLNRDLEHEIAQRTAALRVSEERWQLVLKGLNDGIWDWDLIANRVFYSNRWKTMRGFTGDEVGDRPEEWSQRVHPEDYERVMAGLADHFAGKSEFFEMEYRVQCKDHSYIWILDRGQALRNEAGQAIRMSGSGMDITARKQAAEKLRQVSDRLSLALQAGAIGTWDWDMIQETSGSFGMSIAIFSRVCQDRKVPYA